jgi:hypothetical protein
MPVVLPEPNPLLDFKLSVTVGVPQRHDAARRWPSGCWLVWESEGTSSPLGAPQVAARAEPVRHDERRTLGAASGLRCRDRATFDWALAEAVKSQRRASPLGIPHATGNGLSGNHWHSPFANA